MNKGLGLIILYQSVGPVHHTPLRYWVQIPRYLPVSHGNTIPSNAMASSQGGFPSRPQVLAPQSGAPHQDFRAHACSVGCFCAGQLGLAHGPDHAWLQCLDHLTLDSKSHLQMRDVTVPFLAPPESHNTASPSLPNGLPSNTRNQPRKKEAILTWLYACDSSCDWATARYHNQVTCWQGQGHNDVLASISWHLHHGSNNRMTHWQNHVLAASWHDQDSTDTWQDERAPAHIMCWQDHDMAGRRATEYPLATYL
jgi:hypothetical protein